MGWYVMGKSTPHRCLPGWFGSSFTSHWRFGRWECSCDDGGAVGSDRGMCDGRGGGNYQVITTQMTHILENLTYKMVPVNPPPKKEVRWVLPGVYTLARVYHDPCQILMCEWIPSRKNGLLDRLICLAAWCSLSSRVNHDKAPLSLRFESSHLIRRDVATEEFHRIRWCCLPLLWDGEWKRNPKSKWNNDL